MSSITVELLKQWSLSTDEISEDTKKFDTLHDSILSTLSLEGYSPSDFDAFRKWDLVVRDAEELVYIQRDVHYFCGFFASLLAYLIDKCVSFASSLPMTLVDFGRFVALLRRFEDVVSFSRQALSSFLIISQKWDSSRTVFDAEHFPSYLRDFAANPILLDDLRHAIDDSLVRRDCLLATLRLEPKVIVDGVFELVNAWVQHARDVAVSDHVNEAPNHVVSSDDMRNVQNDDDHDHDVSDVEIDGPSATEIFEFDHDASSDLSGLSEEDLSGVDSDDDD